MNEMLLRRLEDCERQLRELQLRFKQPPTIEIEVDADDTDALIEQLSKVYHKFAACNLTVKVKLNALTTMPA